MFVNPQHPKGRDQGFVSGPWQSFFGILIFFFFPHLIKFDHFAYFH